MSSWISNIAYLAEDASRCALYTSFQEMLHDDTKYAYCCLDRRGFGRPSGKANGNQQFQPRQGNGNGATSPTDYSPNSLAPTTSDLQDSPALSLTPSYDSNSNISHQRTPYFFREQYANLIVKGNFMTLAAKPVLVEEGEWLAHQVVEQNRLLDGMLKIIQEVDRSSGLPICNPHSCPVMNGGPGVTYTWMDQNKQQIKVPAPQYIAYVQRWITCKITDQATFPTDTFTAAPALTPLAASTDPNAWLGKASGFPAPFAADIRNVYRQMLRAYAHVYHAHWLDFWHLGAYKELNTCFIHFVNVGRLFGLLTEQELSPMGPLVDIWLEKGWLPRTGAVGDKAAGSAAAGSAAPSAASAGSMGQGHAMQMEH